MRERVNQVILVYNGDSGLRAVLLDVVKKAAGREDCALCEITHRPLGKRRAWAACEARLGVAFKELHRDQLPASWGIGPDDLPCVLGRAGDARPRLLLSRDQIVACRGTAAQLEQRLREVLDGTTSSMAAVPA